MNDEKTAQELKQALDHDTGVPLEHRTGMGAIASVPTLFCCAKGHALTLDLMPGSAYSMFRVGGVLTGVLCPQCLREAFGMENLGPV